MIGPAHALADALRDRYRIERELGRGGMATVYLAHDLRHDRPVALKVLHPDLAHALGPERFQREIRLAARLQHPHILTVLDSGEAAGQLWFTMPFVEGESLRDRLRREKQLPVDESLRIAREAADALDYAHRHGVIHRDIKPENILLTEGHALVADFGIGKALGGASEAQLTETGLTVGTPAYMSPEQAAGDKDLTARSDVYSLGIVLYEMLAGETPFAAPTAQAMIARRFTEVPKPVRELRDSVPETVSQTVHRALARTAADRYATAAEFANALLPGVTPVATPVPAPDRGPAAGLTAPTPAVEPPRYPKSGRRRVPMAAVSLGLGILIGLGVLFAWRRSHLEGDSSSGGLKRLAVLPFENLGDSASEYFADGVTDAIRGKLTALPGLQVTARSSSAQYKKSPKPPQQVGQELGVQYLLTGTVRWEKGQGGQSQVQVSPELIEVSSAAAKWQQPFEAPLTDVFRVQAEVAGRVAEALDVALGTGQRAQLAERPTANLAAYDAFLRGDAATRGLSTIEPVALRRGLPYYQQAVALDSTFALAWSRLARLHAVLYSPGNRLPADSAAAEKANRRAFALTPDRADTRLALGDYYSRVLGDNARALEQYQLGHRLTPSEGSLLAAMAIAEQSLGRWEDAVAHAREGFRLDPRSSRLAGRLARTLVFVRRYDEALAAADQAVRLDPSSPDAVWIKAVVHVARGDLEGAQAVYRSASPELDRTTLVAFVAQFWELAWTLDREDIDLLVQLSPERFGGDRAAWGLALAQAWALKGDTARTRAYADSGRIAYERVVATSPRNDEGFGLLALCLAYLGRYDKAVAAAKHSLALRGPGVDKYGGAYNQLQLVRVYVMARQWDHALDELEELLRIPLFITPGWLKIDPTFALLRGNPRFEQLVNGR